MLSGDARDPEQVVLSACPLRQGEQCSAGDYTRLGAEGNPCSLQRRTAGRPDSASNLIQFSFRDTLPGREGGFPGPQGSGSAGRKKGQCFRAARQSLREECPAGRGQRSLGVRGPWVGGCPPFQEFSVQAGCHYPVTPPSKGRPWGGRFSRGYLVLLAGLRVCCVLLFSKNKARNTVNLEPEFGR